ncbi:MAG TPA: hypothetical protein VKA27_03190 [Sunxiuqinia sp.]|nr:hypothetical protein [Sunxiuqinia sp.]
MKTSFLKYISAFVFLILMSVQAAAQQDSTKLKQEVEVVKAYQPSVSDAFKINDIPKIKDEKHAKPSFNYQIKSQPIFSTFKVEPVQAAEMVGEPTPELGKGLLKVGFGNYQTPYGEFFYNTNTGKNSNFGMHFKHLSSHGSVKLLNGDKVKAPQSENVAELFANYFFRRSTLNTKLFFNRQAETYYGYPGDRLSDSTKMADYQYWGDKQAFAKMGVQFQLNNNIDSRAPLNYGLNLYYHHFGTKTGQAENLVKLNTNFIQDFYDFKGLLNASASYLRTDSIYNLTADAYGHKQQVLLKVSPAVLWEADIASLKLGVNTFLLFDDDTSAKLLLTPNIKASWSPVEDVMTLFVEGNGKLQQNHYSEIVAENPFVNPFQDIKPTEYQYIVSGGIKGKFTPRFNYRFQTDYASIKNQHFYYLNDQEFVYGSTDTKVLSNTFDVLYDNVKKLTLGAEFYYTASDLVNFHLKGNYYNYQMDKLEQPWQLPQFDATVSTILNPAGPLKFNADIFFVGQRKALLVYNTYHAAIPADASTIIDRSIYNMSSIVDLNFGMNYQYSPQLNFFGRINNFAFQKYENWLGYAQQSFNLLIGASYSF